MSSQAYGGVIYAYTVGSCSMHVHIDQSYILGNHVSGSSSSVRA